MAPPTFIGGKLSLKGDKKKKAKKKKKSKAKYDTTGTGADRNHDQHNDEATLEFQPLADEDDDLTEAERRAMRFKSEKEMRDLEKVAKLSHRERIDEFNSKLSELTEHNDIPRVSAAGNG